MDAVPLPLFPLHTVLFPGTRLSLRIFEPRYLDLVRTCGQTGFGVCLIVDGEEVGATPRHAAVGTQCRIVDFDALPGGLLGITVQGERRFGVLRAHVATSGLLLADAVAWFAPEQPVPLTIEHELLATVLRRLIESLGASHAAIDEACYRDANWVGWRLAELLPLEAAQRQSLLEEPTPQARMELLLELVAQLQTE